VVTTRHHARGARGHAQGGIGTQQCACRLVSATRAADLPQRCIRTTRVRAEQLCQGALHSGGGSLAWKVRRRASRCLRIVTERAPVTAFRGSPAWMTCRNREIVQTRNHPLRPITLVRTSVGRRHQVTRSSGGKNDVGQPKVARRLRPVSRGERTEPHRSVIGAVELGIKQPPPRRVPSSWRFTSGPD